MNVPQPKTKERAPKNKKSPFTPLSLIVDRYTWHLPHRRSRLSSHPHNCITRLLSKISFRRSKWTNVEYGTRRWRCRLRIDGDDEEMRYQIILLYKHLLPPTIGAHLLLPLRGPRRTVSPLRRRIYRQVNWISGRQVHRPRLRMLQPWLVPAMAQLASAKLKTLIALANIG